MVEVGGEFVDVGEPFGGVRGCRARRRRGLTYPEAAELCTLSVRSLKRLTAAGKLRCDVVGGKVLRLKASDVEAPIVPADECRNRE